MPVDTRHMDDEERESYFSYLRQEHERAVESYRKVGLNEKDYRHCRQCGELMPYNSLAYHEGFHFDSCE